MNSPRALGYRLSAEWEPQEGVWLSWPSNRSTWPDHWESVQRTFAEMTLQFSQRETVFININPDQRISAERTLTELENKMGLHRGEVQFFEHETNDAWVRDHGPIYLRHSESGERLICDWQYNAWGGKFPFEKDNKIPRLIAQAQGIQRFEESLVLEGGSLETNGVGDLLVTTDCLLNPNRNPNHSQTEIELALIEGLGVTKVHWLNGCIEGDDTDGHIDNLARFFNPNGLLVASVPNPNDANHQLLSRLNRECEDMILCTGKSPEIIPLPLPDPVYHQGQRLPMSYLNFFIGNGAVFTPSYGQPKADAAAIDILENAFPKHEIIPIDCQNLILEGGALHCLTQQVPQPFR
ncbi:MAG: agmatine deiminase family protein [Verrucomicrobia bacterium]|nr:agmatine deiminase family protein [Verrucomicrobiota bacterium]MDA1065167.1 agmatine deiminase family protein [Verrucomicrobiota bacterium]